MVGIVGVGQTRQYNVLQDLNRNNIWCQVTYLDIQATNRERLGKVLFWAHIISTSCIYVEYFVIA